MPEIVYIARCAAHGLHGQRTACFICGGPVEQVAMATIPDASQIARARGLAQAIANATPYPPHIDGVRDIAREIVDLLPAPEDGP